MSALVFLACSPTPAETDRTTLPGGGQLRRLLPHRTNHLKPGEPAAVVLKGTPSTGYEWKYVARPAGVLQQTAFDAESLGDADTDAAPSLQYWVFRAQSPGQTRLLFHYFHTFTGQTADTLSFRVQVAEK